MSPRVYRLEARNLQTAHITLFFTDMRRFLCISGSVQALFDFGN
jgi:hypothetical protein